MKLLNNHNGGNPRGDTPVAEWLEEWEKNWQRISGDDGTCGQQRFLH